MPRVLVAVIFLLSLGLPALAQDDAHAEQAKRIEELIADLGDEDEGLRMTSALA